jgi:glutamate formiminotransferase
MSLASKPAACVECVPNFSEGRDRSTVDSIVDCASAVPGIALLGHEMDPDHNRAVVTMAGSPAAVAEAAVRMARRAAELIDLRLHVGEHPWIGAADVIPFVPLAGASLEESARLAVHTGERIWREAGVPVYLYEAAARRPERGNLAAIRKGGWRELARTAAADPDRAPDIGGPALHPSAGASAVGARPLLIAFNVNLATPDVHLARAIARRVRESSGGLPAVKALGVYLASRHLAQVTMNLTDFRRTGLAEVYRAVDREARRLGTQPLESQLIGFLPAAALPAEGHETIRLRDFSTSRILENRLQELGIALP